MRCPRTAFLTAPTADIESTMIAQANGSPVLVRDIAKVNITNATNELYADGLYRGFYVPGAERTVTFSLKATF